MSGEACVVFFVLYVCATLEPTCAARTWPGMYKHNSVAEAIKGADVVLLAVKPQHMSVVLDKMGDLSPSAMVISIAAGCPISMFSAKVH